MILYSHLALDPPQEKRDSGKTPWKRFPFLDYDLPGCHTYRTEVRIRKPAAVVKKMNLLQ